MQNRGTPVLLRLEYLEHGGGLGGLWWHPIPGWFGAGHVVERYVQVRTKRRQVYVWRFGSQGNQGDQAQPGKEPWQGPIRSAPGSI